MIEDFLLQLGFHDTGSGTENGSSECKVQPLFLFLYIKPLHSEEIFEPHSVNKVNKQENDRTGSECCQSYMVRGAGYISISTFSKLPSMHNSTQDLLTNVFAN